MKKGNGEKMKGGKVRGEKVSGKKKVDRGRQIPTQRKQGRENQGKMYTLLLP